MKVLSYDVLLPSLRFLVLGGLVPMGIIALLATESPSERVVLGTIVVVLAIFLLSMGAVVITHRDRLIVGFMPLWFVKIPKSEVDEIQVSSVDAWKDFNGVGIKGRSRKQGLLFSGGRSDVIAVSRTDGRKYFISARKNSLLVAKVKDQLEL